MEEISEFDCLLKKCYLSALVEELERPRVVYRLCAIEEAKQNSLTAFEKFLCMEFPKLRQRIFKQFSEARTYSEDRNTVEIQVYKRDKLIYSKIHANKIVPIRYLHNS